MKNIATIEISSKGQMTLPKTVRDKLKLKKGDQVVLYVLNDGTFKGRLRQPFGAELSGKENETSKPETTKIDQNEM